MKKKVLPLGSVVRLKDSETYIVVLGYMMEEKSSKKVWDYMGCLYPVGTVSNDKTLLFNREQIEEIIFEGYSDKEGEEFRKTISEHM